VYVVAVARLQDTSPGPGDDQLVFKERSEAAASRVFPVNGNTFDYDGVTSNLTAGLLTIFLPRKISPLAGSGAKRVVHIT
jgi:hypothetical protein